MNFTKRLLILTILVAFFFLTSCTASRTSKTDAIVDEWLAANNAKDIDRLEKLYTPTVMFYTYTKDVGTCMQEKKAFFDKYPDYALTITNRETDFYKGGIIKCNFIKTEYWKGKSGKPNAAYLLLEKRNGEYLITGESDQRMDTKRSFVPTLGAKVDHAASMLYLIVGVVGGILLLLAIFYYIRKSKRQPAPVSEPAPMAAVLPQVSNTATEKKELTPEEKGKAFEHYIAGKFNKYYFAIIHWTSDKIATNGLYDLSSMEPDLKLMYNNDKNHCFAIECKWRSGFVKNDFGMSGIFWAERRQIDNYLAFEQNNNMPVWVVIGIGGTPDSPAQLFLAPLPAVEGYPFLFESHLNNFRRDPGKNFWYEAGERVLR